MRQKLSTLCVTIGLLAGLAGSMTVYSLKQRNYLQSTFEAKIPPDSPMHGSLLRGVLNESTLVFRAMTVLKEQSGSAGIKFDSIDFAPNSESDRVRIEVRHDVTWSDEAATPALDHALNEMSKGWPSGVFASKYQALGNLYQFVHRLCVRLSDRDQDQYCHGQPAHHSGAINGSIRIVSLLRADGTVLADEEATLLTELGTLSLALEKVAAGTVFNSDFTRREMAEVLPLPALKLIESPISLNVEHSRLPLRSKLLALALPVLGALFGLFVSGLLARQKSP